MGPNRIAPVIKSSQPTDDFYTDKLHFHPCLLCFLVYFVFLAIIHPPSLVSSNDRFRVPLPPLHEHIHHQTSCQSRYSIFLVPPGGCSPNNQSYSMPRSGYDRPKGSSPYQLQGNPAVSKQNTRVQLFCWFLLVEYLVCLFTRSVVLLYQSGLLSSESELSQLPSY